MDDWYITRSLMNSTNAIYVDIANHFISTNNEKELELLIRQEDRSTSYMPIFGHFRPSKRFKNFQHFFNLVIFSLDESARIWRQISCS